MKSMRPQPIDASEDSETYQHLFNDLTTLIAPLQTLHL
jgi:hypothetical protein